MKLHMTSFFNSLSIRSLGGECWEVGVSPEDWWYTLKVFRKAEWFHETIFGTSWSSDSFYHQNILKYAVFRETEAVSKGLIIKYAVFPEACFSSWCSLGTKRTYKWGLNITAVTFSRFFFGEWMKLFQRGRCILLGPNRAFEGE